MLRINSALVVVAALTVAAALLIPTVSQAGAINTSRLAPASSVTPA